jgi:hypothetical protein
LVHLRLVSSVPGACVLDVMEITTVHVRSDAPPDTGASWSGENIVG